VHLLVITKNKTSKKNQEISRWPPGTIMGKKLPSRGVLWRHWVQMEQMQLIFVTSAATAAAT